MIRTGRGRSGLLPLAMLALLAAGCGTVRAGGDVGSDRPSASAVASPSTPLDFPCPGEGPGPVPPTAEDSPTPAPTAPTDHYAENHGFMIPFPLHGRHRCEGLAAVRRVEKALEPLRRRGDFTSEITRAALTRLGYSTGRVQSYQDGPTGVSFLIDDYPLCVEGTLDRAAARADAFGGYPDHPGCDRPSGGH